jgi:two-component system, LytTR family, sensor kinase
MARTRSTPLLVAAGALVLLGLVSASRMYFGYAQAGHAISAFDALGSGLLEWCLWLPLLPLVHRLARAFAFARGRVAVPLGVHLAASLLASLLEIVLFGAASAGIRELRFGSGSLAAELAAGFLFKLHTGCVAYWALLMGFLAWEHAARSRAEAVRLAELARSLAEARLAAVQSQLAPHFLFNALNTIAASLRDDPDAAERMLHRLAGLLRTVLARREQPTQTLADELAFLAEYLELQQERFGPRLAVETRVDPRTLAERVPSFLLLPLVENALQHGLGTRPGPVRLGIQAERVGARVELAIEDDGPGFRADEGTFARRGVGLESARERLRLLHGAEGSFELGRAAGGGAAIRLGFPALVPA